MKVYREIHQDDVLLDAYVESSIERTAKEADKCQNINKVCVYLEIYIYIWKYEKCIYEYMKKLGHPFEFYSFLYQNTKKISGPWHVFKF